MDGFKYYTIKPGEESVTKVCGIHLMPRYIIQVSCDMSCDPGVIAGGVLSVGLCCGCG